MFVCPEDLNALENFAYGDTPDLPSVQTFLSEIFTLGDNFAVSLYDLSARHDIRQLVVRTLLTYLELDGYLEEGTPFYARYQLRPLMLFDDILAWLPASGGSSSPRCFAVPRKPERGCTSTWSVLSRPPARRVNGLCGPLTTWPHSNGWR